MKTKLLLSPIISLSLSLAMTTTAWASTSLQRAQKLATEVSFQDGPNCFNATLLTQGYRDSKVFTSAEEMKYFLRFHCQEIVPLVGVGNKLKPLQKDSVIIYFDEQNSLAHSAVALDSTRILEKNSLYGSDNSAGFGDKHPGKYLLHNIQNSMFFGTKAKPAQQVRTYRCEDASKVKLAVAKIEQNSEMYTLKLFSNQLAEIVKLKDRKQIEAKVKNELLSRYREVKLINILNHSSGSAQLDHYKLAMVESIAYQWNLLNCSEAYKAYDECYAPSMTDSIQALDQFYEKIFKFREIVSAQM